ncbi:snRNA-activating protein complex subunit 4 isoform X2 [Boleophthalmus pectinirostris]|nr:snRNA-activating protein complex subunit 4 isoform X2 [Boleophthalmus pectinirostris]XP_055016193.1 snRNA-activating protein complex subunit 4 isoform X2 [Boleophthalmus pectinirostris]
MSGAESLEEQRRRLQMEVQLLEQSLNTADLTQISSDSEESVSSEDQEPDQNQPGPGPGPEELLEQRDVLHREIQELERSLGPSSLTQHHPDEEDEESSSDESDLELPPSLDSCLQMNLVYQQVLQETLEQLETLLQENERQQKELLAQLSGSDRDQSKPKGSEHVAAKLFMGNFLKPYFKDRLTGLGPPANEETKQKNSRLVGSLDYRRLKTRRWEGWQKVLLIHAVSRDRLRKLIQPKLSRMDFLSQKLSSASDSNKVQISEQIQVLEKDIQALREKKEEELIGDRYEDVDWTRISNIDFEGSREPGDLQCFWQNFLHPSINKDRWTDAEISRLKELSLKNHERDWTRTSEELGTSRTAFMCLQTFQRFCSLSLRKKTWSSEEDAQLRALVDKMRIGNFIPYTQMCYFMEDRLPGQLLYRWSQVLDPTLKKGSWSPEEDRLLLAAVEKHGARNWWKIRYDVPGRTDCACRDRYHNVLKPENKKGPFDEREKLMLRNLVQKHGHGRWSKIAAEIPNRTDCQCMRAYNKLLGEAEVCTTKDARQGGKEAREGGKEAGEETRRREKVTVKDTEKKTTKREQKEAQKELGKETVQEEGVKGRRQTEDSPPSSQRTLRKRRRRSEYLKDELMSEEEEEPEEVTYMDISDEEENQKFPRVCSDEEEQTGEEETGAEPEEQTGAEEQTWVRLDLDRWVSVDRRSRSVLFRAVFLREPEGGSSERVERCTIVEKSGCSEVTIPRPTEVSTGLKNQEIHHNAPVMIRAEDLCVLLQQQARKFSHSRKRLTDTSLSYSLQAAVVPWVGHVIIKEPNQDLPRTGPGLTKDLPRTGPGLTQALSSSRLFRFFLHALRVDADGCKQTIEERRRREQMRNRTVADLLKMKQIKQDTCPSLPGHAPFPPGHAPSLPRAHMYPPLLLRQVTQTQIVRLAPPPGTQSSAPLLAAPQNVQVLMQFPTNSSNSPQTLFTLAPSSQNIRPVVASAPPSSQNIRPVVASAPPSSPNVHPVVASAPPSSINVCPVVANAPPSSPNVHPVVASAPPSSPNVHPVVASAPPSSPNVHPVVASAPPSSPNVHPVVASAPPSSPNVHPVVASAPPSSPNVPPAPPSSTQSSAPLLAAPPQNVQVFVPLPPNPASSLAPPTVFTVMAPVSTHLGRPASAPLRRLRPAPALQPGTSPSAATQNVRPASPSPKQNVCLFRDSASSQKVHVVKVYPASPGRRTQSQWRVSAAATTATHDDKTTDDDSDTDPQAPSHFNALSDHDYTSPPNHSAPSAASSNQSRAQDTGDDVEEEESSPEGKRRRKLTVKALALRRDKVQKQKKRLCPEKKPTSKRRKKTHESQTTSLPPTSLPPTPLPPTSLPPTPLPPTSLPPTPLPPTSLPPTPLPPTSLPPTPLPPTSLPPTSLPPTPLPPTSLPPTPLPPTSLPPTPLPPTIVLLPPFLASFAPLSSNPPLNPSHVSFPRPLVPLLPSNASLHPSLAPLRPSLAASSPSVLLTELCDWLGAGTHDLKLVSRWLSGEGGVSVEGGAATLPYLPPFVCNLSALNTLLQKRAELRKNAAKLLPQTLPRTRAKTENRQTRGQSRAAVAAGAADGEGGGANHSTDTNNKLTNQTPGTTHKLVNQSANQRRETAHGTRGSTNDVTGTGSKPTNQQPGSRKQAVQRAANQKAGCGSEPLSNQEPAQTEEAELTEAVRRIVRECLGSDSAHQLLKARFLSIFTLPALLASLQPITEQWDAEEPITEQQDAEGRGPHES